MVTPCGPLPTSPLPGGGAGRGSWFGEAQAVGGRRLPPTTIEARIDPDLPGDAFPYTGRAADENLFLILLDLAEFQLDWSGAAEDRHRHLEARTGLVDLFHRAVEGCEGAVGDGQLRADFA